MPARPERITLDLAFVPREGIRASRHNLSGDIGYIPWQLIAER